MCLVIINLLACSCWHRPRNLNAWIGYQVLKSTYNYVQFFSLSFMRLLSYSCESFFSQKTVVETKEERLAHGHPVGQDVPYAAMGGITGFSSLMDGYMRLDDSGIGPPPMHMLEQPIGMCMVFHGNFYARLTIISNY